MSEIAKLGKYEIIKELGRGGFGIVYQARDSVLKRAVALKVLHPALTVDPQFLARFQIEAELAAQMEHPNIVPIYDFNQIDGRYVITMGLMARGSLKDHLASYGAMNVHQSKTMLEQVASGLAYAHERDVIHRDLKPGNILIDAQGVARISDFGFAKARSADSLSLSMAGSLLGTPSYMAPEIWEGKPASPRSDIYSLGCIAHEMLTGSQLFQGETPVQVMHAHIVRGPKPLEGLPSVWQSFIDKCLEPESENRYTTVNALLEDLKWGLFDAPQEREREIVLGRLKDMGARTEAFHADKTVGAPPKEEPKRVPQASPMPAPQQLVHQRVFPKPASHEYKIPVYQNPPQVQDKVWESKPALGNRGNKTILYFLLFICFATIVALILLWGFRKLAGKAWSFLASDMPIPTNTKVRSKDGMEMVYVPEGEFKMGSEDSDAYSNESPVREVRLDAYWIDKYEVSNGQYQKCVNAGKCTKPRSTDSYTRSSYYGKAEYDNYPVIYVSWHQAKAYCEWAGGSLPTEAQWEKAARGTDARKYPWGDESPDCERANYSPDWSNNVKCVGDTERVGTYPAGASPYGAMDMAGNVWEWVMDRYGPYDEAETNNPQGPGTGEYRVLRGGSWYSNSRSFRSGIRINYSPTVTLSYIGFRCVSSP